MPDFGITELLTNNRTAQGGSDIIPNKQTGGASGSWVSNEPQPQPTPPPAPVVQNPTPQPQQQQQTGGGIPPLDMRFYAGWDPKVAQADWNATWQQKLGQQSGGGVQGEPDISSIYQPQLNALDALIPFLNQQKQVEMEALGGEYDSSKSAYQQAYERAKGTLGEQNVTLDQSLQDSENKMRRDYLSSQQSLNARFGGGSGAGQAASEIILQEFMRSGGDIRESYASGQRYILQKTRENDEDLQSRMDQLEKSKLQAVKEIDTEYQGRLHEINLRKADIESNKTAARIEALRSAVDRARQIEDQSRQKLYDIAAWNLEQKSQLGQAQKFLDQLTSEVMADLMSRKQGMENTASGSFLSSGVSPQIYNNYRKQNQGESDDAYKDLFL